MNQKTLNTSLQINPGLNQDTTNLNKKEFVKIKDASTKEESKISYIKQLGRINERSDWSIQNKKNNIITRLSMNRLPIPISNYSSFSLSNLTILRTTSNNSEKLETTTNSHLVAKIFKNVNESARRSELSFSNNFSLSSISTISNMKRSSSETTKPTKTMKNTDLKRNAGFVVFFVFLIIFSVAAPLGNGPLIGYIMIICSSNNSY